MANSKVIYNDEILIDISDDTVTPDALAEGVTAHDSNGESVTGTFPVSEVDTQADLINQIKITLAGKAAPTPSGSSDCNFVVSTVFDISTMTIQSISHTYDEIQSAIQEGKQVLFQSNYGLGISYGSLVLTQTNMMGFQLMIQANFGDGTKLYYFSIILHSDNHTLVYPFIVNTTALGG